MAYKSTNLSRRYHFLLGRDRQRHEMATARIFQSTIPQVTPCRQSLRKYDDGGILLPKEASHVATWLSADMDGSWGLHGFTQWPPRKQRFLTSPSFNRCVTHSIWISIWSSFIFCRLLEAHNFRRTPFGSSFWEPAICATTGADEQLDPPSPNIINHQLSFTCWLMLTNHEKARINHNQPLINH